MNSVEATRTPGLRAFSSRGQMYHHRKAVAVGARISTAMVG